MKSNSSLTNLVLLGVIVVLLFTGWNPGPPVPVSAQETNESDCSTGRSIHVSGAAVITVTPDRALIQLGVQSNGFTPDGVHQVNSAQIQRVINAIRELGVEAKDITTDYYIVRPIYEDYTDLLIKGYRIDNTISITLRDVNLADDVILAAFKVGANEVRDLQFYTSELRKYRDQARDQAMNAAREKAQALGEAAGAQTGCVLSINENSWSQYYGSWRGGQATALWAQNVIQNASEPGTADLSEDSPISLGQIAVRAEVTASFSLE